MTLREKFSILISASDFKISRLGTESGEKK